MAGPNQTPFAIRTLERRPDGTMGVVYKDASTGRVITNLSGYQVIDPSNSEQSLEDLGLDLNEDDNKNTETTADQVKDTVERYDGNKGGQRAENGGSGYSRNQGNNFGYVDKPAGLGLVSQLAPGAFGTMLGLVDKGINVNNTMAVNAARESMGVPGLGLGGAVKGALTGPKNGYVGDVRIGDNQYSVGFEAQDKFGRTSMTPDEARTRGLLAGDISLATKDQVKDDVKSFKETYGTTKGNTIAGALAGNISEMVGNVKGFFSNLFGDDQVSNEMAGAFPSAPSGSTAKTTKGTFSDVIGYTDASNKGGSVSAKSDPKGTGASAGAGAGASGSVSLGGGSKKNDKE